MISLTCMVRKKMETRSCANASGSITIKIVNYLFFLEIILMDSVKIGFHNKNKRMPQPTCNSRSSNHLRAVPWAWCAKMLQIWLTFHRNKMCLAKGKESKRQQQAGWWWWCVFECVCVCMREVLQALMCLLHPWKGRKTPIKATHTQKESNRTGFEPSAPSSCFVFLSIFNQEHLHRGSRRSASPVNQTVPGLEGSPLGHWRVKNQDFRGFGRNLKANLKQKRWVSLLLFGY